MIVDIANNLLPLIPILKRARGYRLYDLAGKRYLDLYQNGGRALLGHRPQGLTAVVKEVVSKGVLTDLPSVYGERLEKALKRLFPGYAAVRFFSSRERALELASLHLGGKLEEEEIHDPVLPGGAKKEAAYWRPLLSDSPEEPEAEVLFPILPFSMGGVPEAVCFKHNPARGLPESDIISPVILAGVLRSLACLNKYHFPPWFRQDLLKSSDGWIQRGIYLRPNFSAGLYKICFFNFLKEGFLLSPGYPGPSILPAEASPGEIKKMIKLFKQNPGK